MRHVLLMSVIVCLAMGCTWVDRLFKQKSNTRHGGEAGENVEAAKPEGRSLAVSLDIRDDGLLLHISGIPEGSTLECQLDGRPLSPCHDGALIARPETGDHKITVMAKREGAIVGLVETPTFSITPSTGGTVGLEVGSPLVLENSDPAFVNGMAVIRDEAKTFSFKLTYPAPCAEPRYRCRYDSRSSNFWVNCSNGQPTYTIPKGMMAMGLQYLSVQATCSDQVGPELTYFWYGVPQGYEPLMLGSIKDSTGRYILNLVKADDCPENDQKFECKPPAGDADWAICQQTDNANVFDNPPQGLQVRVACGDKRGPIYIFKKD